MNNGQTSRTLFKLSLAFLFAIVESAYIVAFADSGSQTSSGNLSFSNGISNVPINDNDTHFISGTAVYGYDFGVDEANRLAKDGVFIGKDSRANYVDLAYGNVLLSPDKDITVGTHAGNIHIDAGATVFVMETNSGLIIYDLAQPQTKEVALIINKYKLLMQPGRMLATAAESTKSIEISNPDLSAIPYKNMKQLDLGNIPEKVFVADFSILSAMFTIEPLKRLVISNNAQDRVVLQKLLLNNPQMSAK